MAVYTTIDNPELYFQCKLYTGNGSNGHAQTFDGDENMQPNMVWIKSRSAAENHHIFDSVRGANKRLIPNDTSAEFDDSSNLQSFDSDGFTLGTADGINKNTATFVCWAWKEASGIFDIVTFTGNQTARTISHSLSAKPEYLWIKNREKVESWHVQHGALGATQTQEFNTNNVFSGGSTIWNDTEPTTSVFSVGNNGNINETGSDIVVYLWAGKQGFSKFGKYIGSGNSNGPYVHLGFSPAYVTIFNATSSNRQSYWNVDNKRDTYNVADENLRPNGNGAASESYDMLDFTANGFKIRWDDDAINDAGETFVYQAFAEAPFVNSKGVPCNAR